MLKFNPYILVLLIALFCVTNTFAEQWDIVKSKGKGTITVFYYNSDNFISDASGKLKGIEYDILIAFKAYLKKQGVELEIKFKKSDSFSGLYEEIKYGGSGEFGACSFSMTEQRMKEISFSPKYMPDIEVLINSNNISIAKDEKEFIEIFSKLTALNVPNTTFEENLLNLNNTVSGFKIQGVKSASIIRERILAEPDLFGYIELPTYLKLFQEGVRFKRQNLFKVERNGYGIILPKNSTWLEPINEFFYSEEFKIKVNQIIKKHLGEGVNDLLWKIEGSENGLDQQEITLLTMERETQEMEIKQQALKVQLLIGGVAVVLIIVFLLFYGYRMKRSVNKSLTERNEMIEQQKADLESKNEIIEVKNKDITDSIQYAKMIQDAMLPSENILKSIFKDHFILFQPKDIVSGDFYWFEQVGDYCIVVLADCTGHGVPGAFMSMMGSNFLTNIVTDNIITSTADALEKLDEKVKKALESDTHSSNDGMDIVIMAYNTKKNTLDFSGGMNSIFIYREGELLKYKGDRFSIGADGVVDKKFVEQNIQLEKDDIVYTFTDGYKDQFGGPKGKKFMQKKLLEMLVNTAKEPLNIQKTFLEESLSVWMEGYEQVDDISVIGFKV